MTKKKNTKPTAEVLTDLELNAEIPAAALTYCYWLGLRVLDGITWGETHCGAGPDLVVSFVQFVDELVRPEHGRGHKMTSTRRAGGIYFLTVAQLRALQITIKKRLIRFSLVGGDQRVGGAVDLHPRPARKVSRVICLPTDQEIADAGASGRRSFVPQMDDMPLSEAVWLVPSPSGERPPGDVEPQCLARTGIVLPGPNTVPMMPAPGRRRIGDGFRCGVPMTATAAAATSSAIVDVPLVDPAVEALFD